MYDLTACMLESSRSAPRAIAIPLDFTLFAGVFPAADRSPGYVCAMGGVIPARWYRTISWGEFAPLAMTSLSSLAGEPVTTSMYHPDQHHRRFVPPLFRPQALGAHSGQLNRPR